MPKTSPVIGVDPDELSWVRLLVMLLRHPDPVVPELTRQALSYLEAAASHSGVPGAEAGRTYTLQRRE